MLRRFLNTKNEPVYINPIHVVCVIENTEETSKVFLSTGDNGYIKVQGNIEQVVNSLNS